MGLAKGILNTFTSPNTIANGGGFSSLLIPRKLNGLGVATLATGIGAFGLANEGLKSHNKVNLGKISYNQGPARMTNAFGSGVTRIAKKESHGDYNAYYDMMEEVVSSHGIMPKIDDYGANPALISALYRMGG